MKIQVKAGDQGLEIGWQLLILAVGMAGFCALPFLFRINAFQLRRFFLLGTGAMLGLVIFDLIPDVFELGGSLGLCVTAGVALLFSISHLRHLNSHGHPEGAGHEFHDHIHGHNHEAGFWPFFLSLSGHCLASGMLLAVAHDTSPRVAMSVFIALAAHKGYESLTFSSILMTKGNGKNKDIGAIAVYVLSLPFGVVLTWLLAWFQGTHLNQLVALWISAIAVGSLIGCLFFDFLLPNVRHLRSHILDLLWLVGGLAITQYIMQFV